MGAEPRVLVVMEMEDYVICTSHLDHVSSEAQLGQVELITKTPSAISGVRYVIEGGPFSWAAT